LGEVLLGSSKAKGGANEAATTNTIQAKPKNEEEALFTFFLQRLEDSTFLTKLCVIKQQSPQKRFRRKRVNIREEETEKKKE
jgi:predicted house-cleaning NTP pyrophosphatase (Maf/HAM1 superfamily)